MKPERPESWISGFSDALARDEERVRRRTRLERLGDLVLGMAFVGTLVEGVIGLIFQIWLVVKQPDPLTWNFPWFPGFVTLAVAIVWIYAVPWLEDHVEEVTR